MEKNRTSTRDFKSKNVKSELNTKIGENLLKNPKREIRYDENGKLGEKNGYNLPFQVIETVNETRATVEAKKQGQQNSLFNLPARIKAAKGSRLLKPSHPQLPGGYLHAIIRLLYCC